MLIQLISAVCTIGLIILAILIMTQAVSLQDASKAIAKGLLALVVLFLAISCLGPPLISGLTGLAQFLKTALVWLVVTVLVATLLILFIRLILWKFIGQMTAPKSRDRGEE